MAYKGFVMCVSIRVCCAIYAERDCGVKITNVSYTYSITARNGMGYVNGFTLCGVNFS